MDSAIVEVSKRIRAYNVGWQRGRERRAQLSGEELISAIYRASRDYQAAEWGSTERRELQGEYEALTGRE